MNRNTSRLHIRPLCIDDKESVFSYRSDPDTYKYLSLVPKSIDDIENFIVHSSPLVNVPGTWFQLGIIERATNRLIGDIGIHFPANDPQHGQAEIGYTLHKDFRGRGYATEALSAVVDYLFNTLGKHRITAHIDPNNPSSIKLIERLGFRKEAHFVEGFFFHEKWVDDLVYALLAREWNARKRRTQNK